MWVTCAIRGGTETVAPATWSIGPPINVQITLKPFLVVGVFSVGVHPLLASLPTLKDLF
jgi:hypothetical protein